MRATVKLGFDRARARELQWLFTNARIAPRAREHVMDSFFGFAEALGVQRSRGAAGTFPCREEARAYAQKLIPDAQPTLVISPCSSHALRNWRAGALRRGGGLRGPPARHARDPVRRPDGARARDGRGHRSRGAGARDRIRSARTRCRSCWRCSSRATVLVAPDSGPAHMATMVRTPVVGLYAATQSGAQRAVSFAAVVRERLRGSGAPISRPLARAAAVDGEDRRAAA